MSREQAGHLEKGRGVGESGDGGKYEGDFGIHRF
jgi:hypothetical protein